MHSIAYIGLLAAVENLTAHFQWSSVLLTWTSPFSLDITGVDPDLWYCVEVYNISRGRNPLSTNCSVYEPQFYVTAPNHNPCDLFEFRVYAVNAVGNGNVVSVNGTFHTSKYQTSKYFSPIMLVLHVYWYDIKYCFPQSYIEPAPDAVGIQVEFISTIEMEVKLLFLVSWSTWVYA